MGLAMRIVGRSAWGALAALVLLGAACGDDETQPVSQVALAPPIATVPVRVTVTRDGEPVAGVAVGLRYDQRLLREPVEAGNTNRAGVAEATMEAGRLVFAWAGEPGPARTWSERGRAQAGEPLELHVELSSRTISGVAVGSTSGEPIAGLRVDVLQVTFDPSGEASQIGTRTQVVSTDASGRFEVGALRDGHVRLSVDPSGLDVPRRGKVDATAGDVDVRLEVHDLTALALDARGADGQALSKWRVRLSLEQPGVDPAPLDNGGPASARGTWPPDGCVELPGRGPYVVTVDALGHASDRVTAFAPHGESIVSRSVVLPPESADLAPRARVTVRDREGALLEGVPVFLERGAGITSQVGVTVGGLLEFEVFEGANVIRVGAGEPTSWSAEGRGFWRTADLDLSGRAGEVVEASVVVVRTGSLEVPRRDTETCCIRSSHGAQASSSRSGLGAVAGDLWTFGNLDPGEWIVELQRPDLPVLRAVVSVRPGETLRLDRDRDFAEVRGVEVPVGEPTPASRSDGGK